MTYYADDMPHKCTVWARDGFNDEGSAIWLEPKVMHCRWQSKADWFVDAQGVQRVSSAIIYPEELVAIGSRIALGDFTGTSDPVGTNSFIVLSVAESPDLEGEETLVKVYV